MPENQSQTATGSAGRNPGGEPQVGDRAPEERGSFARPSDTEQAHAAHEGGAKRDKRLEGAVGGMGDGGDPSSGETAHSADQLSGGENFNPSRDVADRAASADGEPGEMTLGNSGEPSDLDPESFSGTDKHTAGAEFADRMPEASSTPASETGRK